MIIHGWDAIGAETPEYTAGWTQGWAFLQHIADGLGRRVGFAVLARAGG